MQFSCDKMIQSAHAKTNCYDWGQNAERKYVLLRNPEFSLFVKFCKKIKIGGKMAGDQQRVQKAMFFCGIDENI